MRKLQEKRLMKTDISRLEILLILSKENMFTQVEQLQIVRFADPCYSES